MIGMNSLGQNGRIGNQMFQYAGLVGISKNRKFDFCIPDHSNVTSYQHNDRSHHHELQRCFKLSYLNGRFGLIHGDIVELTQHHFCNELFEECPDNVTLNGYFESYEYFKNATDELKKDFQFNDEIFEYANKFHSKNHLKNSVSITVRRGDFLNYPDKHPVCSNDYYQNCINDLDKTRQYVIISDDIEWCKNQEIFSGNNFYFIDHVPENIIKGHYDMCIGSLCDDFIISNSTFAWWVSWLGKNENKKIYAPDPWFGVSYKEFITDGYYTSNMIKVSRKI